MTKETLEHCAGMARLRDQIWERFERMRARAEAVTPMYAAVGGRGSGVSDKVGDGVAAMDELMRQFESQLDAYACMAVEVNGAIMALGDPSQQSIMGMRYLDGMGWERIAVKVGYSVAQCYRIHAKALKLMGC